MMNRVNLKDVFSGLIFLAVGGFFKYFSNDYDIGTLSLMGPGYFPNLISSLLLMIGAIVTVKGLFWKS